MFRGSQDFSHCRIVEKSTRITVASTMELVSLLDERGDGKRRSILHRARDVLVIWVCIIPQRFPPKQARSKMRSGTARDP
jgi:hypothetical protein